MKTRKNTLQKERAYMRIYEQTRKNIVDGVYLYGARLPSKRSAAENAGVSVITVEHAYALLCEEGYVEARPRSGYFVIYRNGDFLSDEIGNAKSSPTPTHINTGRYEFPYSVLAKTMRRVLLDYAERILESSPSRGTPELRRAISAYLARSCGIAASYEQIVVGSGAEYLYGLIAQMLGKDRIFALEAPSYEKIASVYGANGIDCEFLKMGDDGILSSELARSRASVLHITPYCSFPSGVTASVTKRMEYLAWAAARNGYIIEDNYDSETTISRKNDDTVYSLSNGSVIYLNTFSRTVSQSLRVGYMVLPPTLTDEFERRLGFYSCTVPVFEQYVIAELINSGDFERHINRVRRQKRKEAATQLL